MALATNSILGISSGGLGKFLVQKTNLIYQSPCPKKFELDEYGYKAFPTFSNGLKGKVSQNCPGTVWRNNRILKKVWHRIGMGCTLWLAEIVVFGNHIILDSLIHFIKRKP